MRQNNENEYSNRSKSNKLVPQESTKNEDELIKLRRKNEDLISKFQIESFQRRISMKLREKFRNVVEIKQAENDFLNNDQKNKKIENIIRKSLKIATDFSEQAKAIPMMTSPQIISPAIICNDHGSTQKKANYRKSLAIHTRNSSQDKLRKYISDYVDMGKFNSDEEELHFIEDTNFFQNKSKAKTPQSYGDIAKNLKNLSEIIKTSRVKKIINLKDVNSANRGIKVFQSLPLVLKKTIINKGIFSPDTRINFRKVSINGKDLYAKRDQKEIENYLNPEPQKRRLRDKFVFFDTPKYIQKNGKSSSVYYPLLSKNKEKVENILTVEKVYQNIFK